MTLHRGYFLAISGQTSQAHPHQPLPLHHPISMGYSVWLQPAVPLCSHPAKQWRAVGWPPPLLLQGFLVPHPK